MREAGLSRDEARRVFLLEIARWNYRVHVITHVEALSEAERRIFDGSIRNRLEASRVSRIVYEHLKPTLHAQIVDYVESVHGAA